MKVILLNGCTSAGKSSIAAALQERLAEPYLLTGIDEAFRLIPSQYHGTAAGFRFDRDPSGRVRLHIGPVGRGDARRPLPRRGRTRRR